MAWLLPRLNLHDNATVKRRAALGTVYRPWAAAYRFLWKR
jgi:hypothetical protein